MTRKALAVFGFVLLCAALNATAGEIQWRSGTATIAPAKSGDVAMDLATMAGPRSADRHVIVQFADPLTSTDRQGLADGGLHLLRYVGDNAYFAAVDGGTYSAPTVAQCEGLQAAVPIERDWKLHPSLARDEIVPWAVTNPTTEEPADETVVAAYVLFHPDIDLIEAAQVARNHGASIRSFLHSVNGLVVEIPLVEIKPLADEDAVQYIEPPLPKFSEMNNSNRQLTGADTAQAPPYGLDGSGISVMVYDGGGVLTTHLDFGGRATIRDDNAVAEHSTHVAGTIGGDGTESTGLYRGMAPAVILESYGFDTGGPLEAGFLYTDPGDIEQDYDDAINNLGCDIANNSIGTNTAPNGFPCEWTGDYGVTSALIDSIVRGSLGTPFRLVWANGNERQTARCGDLYATTAPPAGAKNHLAIGAVNSNDDSMTDFSSWGPVDDGRLKPDFCAPGCQSDDDEDVTSTSAAGGYSGHCGTSMATPTVTGLAALLLQDYRASYPAQPDPRNSTLKVLFAHAAVDLDNPGPDYQTGYGSLRIIPAIDQMRSGDFLETDVRQGDVIQFMVTVEPGTPELKVTLAWDDFPGTPNVSPALVNDIDLRVIDTSYTTHWPWTLDPLSPADPAVRTQADHANNIEQVAIESPLAGEYVIEIAAYNVPEGPQTISLTASPTLHDCSPMGTISLDRIKYRCQSTATIRVNDCDLNGDDGLAETVLITVASDTEPSGETVTLTETGFATGVFEGTMGIDTTDAAGVLLVTEGDTVTAAYIDADDWFGGTDVTVTDTAVIDCTPPVISDVASVDLEPRAGYVEFNTDEDTQAVVRYGLSCVDLTETAEEADLLTSHRLYLAPIVEATTYFYEVEATDAAGNVSTDDNGGACHSFTTPDIPDYFTEQFSGAFDLSNTAVLLVPNGTFEYYEACSYTITDLPTDPAGAAELALDDSNSVRIDLAGGAEVLLYGNAYGSFYVNANGNVTFGLPDNDQTESYEDHFDQPRISGFFDDLNPGLRGDVSWQQLDDRAVVSWVDVTEDFTANSNTFQIEMYYDGRIQIAWLGMLAKDGVVGLSEGIGLQEDFGPSDLSAYSACGPRTPSATSRTVVVGQDRSTTVTLLASDDGEPDPPGALAYTITTLPTQELRDAGNDHVILGTDLPYTISGGVNEVVYTSSGGFLGADAFEFMVNDGGTPPDAGDSNAATVTVQVDPVLIVPFFEGFPLVIFDDGNWSLVQNATIDDFGIGEPSTPFAVRLNGYPEGVDEITTHLIDLSAVSAVRLTYSWQRTGGGDGPEPNDDLTVEFYNDAGIWELVQQHPGNGPDMTEFQSEAVFLPATALHEDFRLRLRSIGTATGSSVLDDWFVDDIGLTVANAPLAEGSWVTVPPDTVRDVTLHATDPNDDPMNFMIESLPDNGTLSDPVAGQITAPMLPYTLLAQGNVVQYQPGPAYTGPDTFSFKANDGVYESNVATVAVSVEAVLALPFAENYPATNFDTAKWSTVEGATIDDLGIAEPSAPYAARFNGQPFGGDLLLSRAVNLEGRGLVRLQYYWQRTGDGNSPEAGDDLVLEYLDETAGWQLLNVHDGGGADMDVFELADVLLPAEALHPDFRLRFTNTGDLGDFDDWFVDDVLIFEETVPTAYDQTVEILKFNSAQIDLEAFDPNGDPLDYIILSLPGTGTLKDVAADVLIDAGSLPYTLVENSDLALFEPPLGYAGQEAFQFKVSDGVNESNTATVDIIVGEPQAVYDFPFNSDPGWSTEGQWEFGVPLGEYGDPESGFTGVNVYGYNLAGRYGHAIPEYHLTTPALDFSGLVDTELRFYRWLGVEEAVYDHANLEISTDGETWSPIWEHTGATINEQEWTLQVYDISAVADLQPTIYFRWGMGPSDGGVSFQGWNIDDVSVRANLFAGEGDVDGDGDVDAVDLRVCLECLFGPNVTPAPPAPMTVEDCLGTFDLDTDADVDLRDFTLFQRAFMNPPP